MMIKVKNNANKEYDIDLDAVLSRMKKSYDRDPMKKHTDRQIRIIRLRYVNKMSLSAIAKEVGISTEAVKSWVQKGNMFMEKDERTTPWSV